MPAANASSPRQLKVMISSTSLDLPNHRKAVQDAVLRAGCTPLAMEHASAASNSDAIRFSLEMVDRADVYVGIFAQRYGFVPENEADNPQRWSVTEHEYRQAVARGIPRLIYVAAKDHAFTEDDIDFDPTTRACLEALKAELVEKEICGFFSSAGALQSLVIQSLFEEKDKYGPEALPELRAVSVLPSPPEFYTVPPYILTTTFVGRRAELADLDAWAASRDPVLVVEAIGGMGKSALTWEWTQQHAVSRIPGLAGRVWWSFYERGTSMKAFLQHALAYVTRQDPDDLRSLSTYECGEQLLVELRRRPYLLVLDGFERVLTAYHRSDKAQVLDDQVAVDRRECTNPRDGDVLRQLVQCGPSKVLVSTRLMPRVLEDRHTHRPIPGVRHLPLEGLARVDALALVHSAGVRGDEANILRFAEQFGRHALLLRIVCGMVTDYRPRPGDFDAWRTDAYAGGGLKLSELPLKQRYTHILEFAFRGLEANTRQLLSRISVLSDSAHYDTIVVLNALLPPRPEAVPEPKDLRDRYQYRFIQARLNRASSPEERAAAEAERDAYLARTEPEYREQKRVYEEHKNAVRSHYTSAEYRKGMADFHAALADLEDRGLLQWDRDANTYDLHPVIRAFAFEQLEERDRTHAYNTISDHFAALPPENVGEATDLSHVKNNVEIVRSLIGARRDVEALRVYTGALSTTLYLSIGAYQTIVELLNPILERLRDGSVVLTPSDKSFVLNDMALASSRLGRVEESIHFFGEAIGVDLEGRDWDELTIVLRNLGIRFRVTNRLALAARIYDLAYDLAVNTRNESGVRMVIFSQMAAAIIMGKFEEAEQLHDSFSCRRHPSHVRLLKGEEEYWAAVSAFFQGTLTVERLDIAREVAVAARILSKQHTGAALRAEFELAKGLPGSTLDTIDRALTIVRRIGSPAQVYMAIRALALARLGRTTEAREALDGMIDLAEGSTSRAALHVASAWRALGDLERARTAARQAYRQAWADGPPYIHWYNLKQCRELMAELGEPEPQLPPFDPAKIEPIPHEAEIRAVIARLKRKRAKNATD